MPSQEPAVDDKDDDVDLPSEETGGSKAAPPTPGRLLPSPPDHGPSLDPTCHPKAMSASMPPRSEAGDALSRPLIPGQIWVGREPFPGPFSVRCCPRRPGLGSPLCTA